MSTSNKSLSVYRHFLRSIKAAFRGDDFMLASARQEVRTRFQSAAGVTDPDEIDKLCAEGRDAAQFLTQYVVQAKLNERGNFAMAVEPHHTETVAEEAALRPDRSQV
ncbi:probable mitochondrial zinc maintenance protein 1, mitochondrial [Coccomyxa sp. Obi]|nr:probable mitochondrial zinc maintenance protein 1, mitochondrial [Coccomyxa sp. Obi]